MDKLKKLVLGNLNLVLALVGVFILLISYVVGYQNIATLNTDMESKLSERSTYLTQLKEYYSNIAMYRSSITDAKSNISNNLSRLPCGIESEDFLLYLMGANEEIGGKLLSIGFSDPELISQFETVIDEKTIPVSGYSTTTTTSATMSYEQLKKFLEYVYDENKSITYVDSVSATYSGEGSTLNTVWNLSKFFIEYGGSEYKPVTAPDVATGKKDLFGTK